MSRQRIDAIQVGERRRTDMGDIAGLAASIDRHGLIQPIVIDDACNLVAGGRRLAAVTSLGWETVECRAYGSLSDVERREIELEENLQRKDLTPYERSRNITALAETAAAIDKDTYVSNGNVSHRPEEAGSIRRAADRIGVAPSEISKARAHVAAVEEHHLPPDVPQTVAIDYARAVRDEPTLAGQPVADVVNFQREKRAAQKEAQRQQAQDEQDELNHAFTLLGPESQARMADAAFRVRLGTMLGHVETLIRCDPERVSEIQTESDRRVFGIFAREVRAWLLAVERLINQTGLRVVGERTAGEGEG